MMRAARCRSSQGLPCAQFAPKAVVDIDQDGVPEVVVHTDDGPIFGDLVYGYRQLGGWQVVARGVPGSTA